MRNGGPCQQPARVCSRRVEARCELEAVPIDMSLRIAIGLFGGADSTQALRLLVICPPSSQYHTYHHCQQDSCRFLRSTNKLHLVLLLDPSGFAKRFPEPHGELFANSHTEMRCSAPLLRMSDPRFI